MTSPVTFGWLHVPTGDLSPVGLRPRPGLGASLDSGVSQSSGWLTP
jgi:hypothetical protein